ncbi:MAG: UvrD-helicase domain-containing protein, partial [Bacilli bacterium]|nr:UvrD-helicase domain-containing protein [Bacilli bacterium]
MAWTKAQQQAIDSRAGNFLVSAGAGSGKTAVLTERIAQIIASKEAKISEFLVLTFSNKAAHEMKSRIRDKLATMGLTEASEEVERADITTFDAYARRLVVKYHDKVVLPFTDGQSFNSIREDFDIIDENYLSIIKHEILEQRLPSFLEQYGPAKEMFKEYCIKDYRILIDLILKVQALVDKYPNRDSVYEALVSVAVDDGFIDDSLKTLYDTINAHLKAAEDLTSLYPDGDLSYADGEFIRGSIDLVNYDNLYTLFKERKENKQGFKRLSKTVTTDEVTKSYREIVKKNYNSYVDLVLDLGDSESQRARLKSFEPYIQGLVALSIMLDKEVLLVKYSSSSWTFGDVFSMACQLVKQDEIRNQLSSQYKFIMVDEYQDTNQMQEDFIQAIASDNVFAVGDIKQSIYRFRNAEPSIFRDKFNKYDKGDGGTLIRLQDNFRSRKEVVDDINRIFGNCMSDELGGVDYRNGHNFNWGNKALYESTCSDEHNIEIIRYEDLDKNAHRNQDEREAMVIANDIIAKIESGYEVMGKGGMRPCTPSDFAILISRKSHFDIYKKVFSEAKIPLAVSSDSDLSSEDILMAFKSLLGLVYYVDKDDEISANRLKFSYVSLMRSYLLSLTDEEIYHSIKGGSYLTSDLVTKIKFLKPQLMKLSIHDATDELLHFLPFVDDLPKVGNIIANFEKIKSVLDIAKSLDKTSGNIEDFYIYLEDLDRYDLKIKVKESGESGEGVQLMSVHASKGLEFPIIYCPDLARRVNKSEASGAFLVDDEYGIALPRAKSNETPTSMLHYLISQRVGAEAQNEFLRLFYVDLTRAKEKIILVTKKDDSVQYDKVNSWEVLKTKTTTKDDGTVSIKASVRSADSFIQFMTIANIHDIRIRDVGVNKPHELLLGGGVVEPVSAPIFKNIEVKPIIKERRKASKTTLNPVDEGALAYGTRLHRLMELVDLKTKDVSFIKSEKERAIIDNALNVDGFPNVDNARIYHEYAFFDKELNIHGSIDLLLIYEDHAFVIDYKTRHIDDPEYAKQLGVYKAFVERTVELPCKTALLSIL